MYKVLLDDILLPITPSVIDMKAGNGSSSFELISMGEINVIKSPKLKEYSFEAMLPTARYSFAEYEGGYKPPSFFIDKIEKLRTEGKPFNFIVNRVLPNGVWHNNTLLKVSLESYSLKEDANEGFDVIISIDLKEYREYGSKKFLIKGENLIKAPEERPSDRETSKFYTVKSGDSLWKICKSEMGDGSKWGEVAKINNISNPNFIKIGQVIKLG